MPEVPASTIPNLTPSSSDPDPNAPKLPAAIGADAAKELYRDAVVLAGQLKWDDVRFCGHLQKYYLGDEKVRAVGASKLITFYRLAPDDTKTFIQELENRLILAPSLGEKAMANLHSPADVTAALMEMSGGGGVPNVSVSDVDDSKPPWED